MDRTEGKLKKLYQLLLKAINFRSIQFVITTSFALITIIAIIFIGFILYGKYSKTAQQDLTNKANQTIDQVSLNIDNYQKSLLEIFDIVEEITSKKETISPVKIENTTDTILQIRDDISEIALFSEDGKLLMGNPFKDIKDDIKAKKQEWFIKALKSPDKVIWSAPYVQNLFSMKYNWVLSISKVINYKYEGNYRKGILLININFSSISQLCERVRLGNRGYIFIVNNKGNIIYHPKQDLIYEGLVDENISQLSDKNYTAFIRNSGLDKQLVAVKNVSYEGWKVVGIAYINEMNINRDAIINFSMLIFFFAILFIIVVFVFISAKITKPIKELERSMKRVQKGKFDTYVDIEGEGEIVQLANSFNLMVKRIDELMNQIVVEQEAKRKSEFEALQSQINPHFLYNTLDSIVWMAENNKIQESIMMVTALSRLFRISISRGKNIITVKQELEHAKNYLTIQNVRYKNKFKFYFDIDENVLQYKTLKLILQPIIENAIYHGIEYMVDEGSIKITAMVRENSLMFIIKDNGVGMNKEQLDKVFTEGNKAGKGSGVGLKNVNERIRLYFGKEYGIDIESEQEEGTTVSIKLPIMDGEEREIIK